MSLPAAVRSGLSSGLRHPGGALPPAPPPQGGGAEGRSDGDESRWLFLSFVTAFGDYDTLVLMMLDAKEKKASIDASVFV